MSRPIPNFPDDHAGAQARERDFSPDCPDDCEGCPKCDRQMAEDERAERIADQRRDNNEI